MKKLIDYINEKLVINKNSKTGYSFKIDIDAASDAESLLKGIEEVYGKTDIHAEDGKY